MNQRNRVLEYLGSVYPGTRANGEIAFSLDMPEPSVRRATSELELAGKIEAIARQRLNEALQWRARNQSPAALAEPTLGTPTLVDPAAVGAAV